MQDAFLSNLTSFIEKDVCFENALLKSHPNMTHLNQAAIEKLLGQCYSRERIDMMKNGLKFMTYRLNFVEGDNSELVVRFTRFGNEIFPPKRITSSADVKDISDIQAASITIEVLILALNVVGVKVKLADSEINDLAKTVVSIMEKSSDHDEFMEIIERIGNSPSSTDRANAMFDLLKLLNKQGVFWTLVKDVCKHMKWYQWVISSAEIAATLVAAFATDGIALIAKMALAIDAGVQFMAKFAAMSYLSSIAGFMN